MTINWRKLGWGLLAADLAAVNLAAGWLVYRLMGDERPQRPVIESGLNADGETGELLRLVTSFDRLEGRVAELERDEEAPEAVPTTAADKPVIVSNTAVKTKVRSTQYVTVPGSGSSRSLGWESLTGTDFYFDKADYPGLTEVYFEANMSLVNGNGMAYVRLYDVTHGIGVDGSEMQTKLQAATVISSGRVNFWAGRNLIRVQAKTLTADTAVYGYGRLKIVMEN